MKTEIKKGEIKDLKNPNVDKTTATIVDKSYDGMNLKDVNMKDSLIAKTSFVGSTLTNSTFIHTEFLKVDFTGTKFVTVVFDNCEFNSTDFSGSELSFVDFVDCTFPNCTFKNIKKMEDVTGLEKMATVINDSKESIPVDPFVGSDFDVDEEIDGVKSYLLSFGPHVSAAGYFDSEVGIWRITLFVDKESNLTIDLYDGENWKSRLVGGLKFLTTKIAANKEAVEEINSYLSQEN